MVNVFLNIEFARVGKVKKDQYSQKQSEVLSDSRIRYGTIPEESITNFIKGPPTYTLKSKNDKTPPCLIPFETVSYCIIVLLHTHPRST